MAEHLLQDGIELGLLFGGARRDWREHMQAVSVPLANPSDYVSPAITPIEPWQVPNIGDAIELAVVLAEGIENSVQMFYIDGRGQIIPKNKPAYPGLYTTKVIIQEAQNHGRVETVASRMARRTHLKTTWHPSNCVYLTLFNSFGGIEVFCFSVVSQNGNFYAVVEKINQFQAYVVGNNKIVFLGCGWQEFITKVLEPAFENWSVDDGVLPHANTFVVEAEDELLDITPTSGVVLWYNVCKGWGAVRLNNGKLARVHWKNVLESRAQFIADLSGDDAPETYLTHLCPGDEIAFGAIEAPHQTNDRRTAFEYEVFEVTLESVIG